MNRTNLDVLKRWIQEVNRKPLVLRGARQVGKTWLIRELAKQLDLLAEGMERFGSSLIARLMVRSTINVNKSLSRLLPARVNRSIEERFRPVPLSQLPSSDTPAFDKIRASDCFWHIIETSFINNICHFYGGYGNLTC